MSHKDCGCPIISSEEYEGKTFNWEGRAFYTEKVSHFFRVPMNLENKMAQAAETIEKRGYILEEPLMILVREGTFSGTISVAILPPEEESADVHVFSNTFIEATVYDRREPPAGPGTKAFLKKLAAQNKRVSAVYLWHLGCPRCVQLEGHRTVIFAELATD